MNTPRRPRFEPTGMRRSRKVALILLGSAGVIGAAAVYDAWSRESEEENAIAAEPAPEALSPERTYANNHYVPGAGYYHAPFSSWFPFPLNYYDPARGYFSGGQWRPAPFASEVQQSRPHAGAVSAAMAARRAQASSSAARGLGTAKPSVTRGGFGSTAHGASGGAS